MSQLVACNSRAGLVLAADRRVVMSRAGQREFHSLRKLFPLGTRAAVATSGAAIGIAVSRNLNRWMRRHASLPFAELEEYALHVFQREYDHFVAEGRAWFAAHPWAHRRSYVLLGGWAQPKTEPELRFYASEEHGDPYHTLPIGQVVTAPRRLGLEAQLHRAALDGAAVEDLAEIVLAGLRRVAEIEEAVAAPFDAALFSGGRVRFLSTEG